MYLYTRFSIVSRIGDWGTGFIRHCANYAGVQGSSCIFLETGLYEFIIRRFVLEVERAVVAK